MLGQLCAKLICKIPLNASRNSISNNPLYSSLLKPNAHSFHQKSFSRYNLGKSTGIHGVTGTIKNGFSTSSFFGRRLFASTLLNGKPSFLVNCGIWIQGKRYFHSFDSNSYGWRSVFRRLSADGVVISLIGVNVAVFILWRVASPHFMLENFMISVDNFTTGRLHTLVTAAFSHRDSWHLISNMVGLYFFGLSIGRTFGPEYLLKLYLSGAVVGSIFYLVYHTFVHQLSEGRRMYAVDPFKVPGLGASGAVNAIMLLDIFLFPTKTLYLDFIIPVPAVLLGIFMIGKDILRMVEGDPQISGSAHLGGAAVAAISWVRISRGRFRRF